MHYSVRTRKCPLETGNFVERKTSLMEHEYVLCVRAEQKQEETIQDESKEQKNKTAYM